LRFSPGELSQQFCLVFVKHPQAAHRQQEPAEEHRNARISLNFAIVFGKVVRLIGERKPLFSLLLPLLADWISAGFDIFRNSPREQRIRNNRLINTAPRPNAVRVSVGHDCFPYRILARMFKKLDPSCEMVSVRLREIVPLNEALYRGHNFG